MNLQDWTIVVLLAGLTSVAGGEVIMAHLTKPHTMQVAKSAPRNGAGTEPQFAQRVPETLAMPAP